MADDISTLLREGEERSGVSDAIFEELLRDRHEFWLRPMQILLVASVGLDALLKDVLGGFLFFRSDYAAPLIVAAEGPLAKLMPALTIIVVGFGIFWTFYSIAARRRRAETRIAMIRAELIDRFLAAPQPRA